LKKNEKTHFKFTSRPTFQKVNKICSQSVKGFKHATFRSTAVRLAFHLVWFYSLWVSSKHKLRLTRKTKLTTTRNVLLQIETQEEVAQRARRRRNRLMVELRTVAPPLQPPASDSLSSFIAHLFTPPASLRPTVVQTHIGIRKLTSSISNLAKVASNPLSLSVGWAVNLHLMYNVSWVSRSLHSKQDVDPFSCYCTAPPRDRVKLTDTHAMGSWIAAIRISCIWRGL